MNEAEQADWQAYVTTQTADALSRVVEHIEAEIRLLEDFRMKLKARRDEVETELANERQHGATD